jgi:hypothetical protein
MNLMILSEPMFKKLKRAIADGEKDEALMMLTCDAITEMETKNESLDHCFEELSNLIEEVSIRTKKDKKKARRLFKRKVLYYRALNSMVCLSRFAAAYIMEQRQNDKK